MRWRGGRVKMEITRTILIFVILMTGPCDGSRRTVQRRKEIAREPEVYEPSPSVESLTALAQAMGAAEYEHYTEGRPLVKRLIPAESQPDLDVVEHQGIIGRAGVDFPAYPNIPTTGFNCKNVLTGYYADLETDCQVFHICDTSRKISFLCPNGTIFSQSHLICDWWFKVDCASAPALYESSAEYYSNEQKKSQKVNQNFKNQDLQYIGDGNVRAESRRASVNIPSTTERLQRHRQRLQTETPFNFQGTARSFQTYLDYRPTQRNQASTAFERRRNLVQLITNSFALPRPTPATIPEAPRREDFNIKEMQVAAETASFANNNNRQFLQDFHSKNYRPYPVYASNNDLRAKLKPNPNLTTLYDIRDKQAVEPSESTVKQTSQEAPEIIKELNQAQDKSVRLFTPNNPNNYLVHIPKETRKPQKPIEIVAATKRPSLVQYTKSYSTIVINNPNPYTRPGVSALKSFLEREKNKTFVPSTEPTPKVTIERTNILNREKTSILNTTDKFESSTKIPVTTRNNAYTATTEPIIATQSTEDPSYKERRERLQKKLNLNTYTPAEVTTPIPVAKFYSDQPTRPGLIVPPSLTPKTLHSLAIYYATALDNLSTTSHPDDVEITTVPIDEYKFMEKALPALFSKQTIDKYSNLFSQTSDQEALIEEMKLDLNETYNDLPDDLSTQQSQNPLATSPQIRELAQVFTHALSAYLQDPVQFRKVLSEIRPTHPSFGDLLSTTEDPYATEPTTTVNEEDDEILGFSDDSKLKNLQNLREGKSLSSTTSYPDIQTSYSTETVYPSSTTTHRNPFRCCGSISASYTSAPYTTTTTPSSYTLGSSTNYYGNSESTTYYSVPKYGGFQNNAINNNNEYENDEIYREGKPLSEYEEVTNLPSAWGVDITRATPTPDFESKKIRTSTFIPTSTPVYFTETDNVELDDLENEEELQRAHSQSFLPPQSNSLRHGKQLNIEQTSTTVKEPSEDLEVPTSVDVEVTTAQTTTLTPPLSTTLTTTRTEEPEISTTTLAPTSIFTSSDSDKTTNEQWQTPYEDWPSTIIDPITLNDNLTPTGPEATEAEKENNTYISTSTTESAITTEQIISSTSNLPVSTDSNTSDRTGRLLRDFSTEPSQDLSAITDTVVEKAKEIMGGMNSTTTEKLMNVMKKTKSKSVKRLILLLVQTCDDDHNATAEASKRALLEALMAISQKDMDEIAKESGTELPTTGEDYDYGTIDSVRRMDVRPRSFDRRGKSIRVEASAVNSLSGSTTDSPKAITQETISTTAIPQTTPRRGVRKYKTTPLEAPVTKAPFKVDRPVAEARTASKDDLKTAADTRALELLRSLYTIAAKWG